MNQFNSEFAPFDSRPINDGVQHRYKFPNGFGASVVKSPFSYGGDEGLWELGVYDERGALTYDTPITSDVIGYLSELEVKDLLDAIAALPAPVSA